MKIIADNKIPFLEGVFEPFCDIEYFPGNKIDKSCIEGAEVLIIRTRTICNKELLEGSSIKFIATATIGFDHIDIDYCLENNISWINAPGCNSGAVQQWFIAALLYYAKQASIDLKERTLGVVGVGNVGRKIVKFAEVLGMPVLLNDPPREEKEGSCIFRGIETIQRECDIITFHVPLNMDGDIKTYHLVDKKFLDKINPSTILINSSRGEVVDNQALNDHLNIENRERGLLFDVWEKEPNISKDLLHKTSIATPHIAGYSEEGKANGTAAVVQAVGKYLGLPLDDWIPEEQEMSRDMRFQINCKNKSLQEILTEVILETYSIIDDDMKLRENTDIFESLRSNYNLRRETSAWEVELINKTDEISIALKQLGFKVF